MQAQSTVRYHLPRCIYQTLLEVNISKITSVAHITGIGDIVILETPKTVRDFSNGHLGICFVDGPKADAVQFLDIKTAFCNVEAHALTALMIGGFRACHFHV